MFKLTAQSGGGIELKKVRYSTAGVWGSKGVILIKCYFIAFTKRNKYCP